MKNILYKILPVCLLTIGLTGCEDETKYRPLPEAVPLTMSINEKAFVMGEHLKVDIKVEPDADGNEVVANEDFDIYFTAKAGTEDVANVFEPFSSIVTFPKGEKQIQVDFPVKTSGLVGTTTMEFVAFARGYKMANSSQGIKVSDYYRISMSLENNTENVVTEGGKFVLVAKVDKPSSVPLEVTITPIEWGYRYFPEAGNLKRDNEKLRAWVDERRQDSKLFYIEETTYSDPRVQSEDSGDDVIKANRLGMNNLKYIMAHLEEWTDGNDPDYYVLRKRYLSVLSQYQNYIEHVLRYVGGRYSDNPTREEELRLNQPVSREKEDEAWAFLEEYLCKEQDWLFVADVMEKTGVTPEFYEQEEALGKLTKLLLKYSALHKNRQLSEEGFTADELLNRLYLTIFEAKGQGGKLSQYDQALQSGLLQNLVINVENPYNLSNGVGVVMQQVILKIKQHTRAATEGCSDALTASHYKTLYNFITLWEKGGNKALIELN